MSDLKRCFKALGFTAMPGTAEEIETAFSAALEKHKDSTETDRLARQTLRENRDLCLAELEKGGGA